MNLIKAPQGAFLMPSTDQPRHKNQLHLIT